jgi:hypothetical protein
VIQRIVGALLCAVLLWPATSDAQARSRLRFRLATTAPVGSPIAANQHPRLLFTIADLPTITTRLCSNATVKAQVQLLYDDYEIQGFSVTGLAGLAQNHHAEDAAQAAFLWTIYDAMTACSITGRAHTKTDYFNQAKAWMNYVLTDGPGGGPSPLATSDVLAFGDFLALDWLYNSLTAGERAAVCDWGTNYTTDASLNTPWASVYGGAIPGTRLMAALACKGMGGAYDTWADGIIATYAADFYASTGHVYTQTFGIGCPMTSTGSACSVTNATEGGSLQGELYWDAVGPFGTLDHLLFAEESYRTAYGETRAAHYNHTGMNIYRYWPRFLVDLDDNFLTANHSSFGASTTPDGKAHFFYKDAASSAAQAFQGHGQFYKLWTIAKAYETLDPTAAGYAQWLLTNRIGAPKYIFGMYAWLHYFVTGGEVTPVDPTASLPLSNCGNNGKCIFRTGWQTTANDQVRVTLELPKWIDDGGGRYQSVPGFAITRKAPMVFRQGFFGHDGGGGRSHGSNMMVFPDNTTTCTPSPCTQGGMRWGTGANPGFASDLVEDGGLDVRGTVLTDLYAGSAGHEYDYVSADIAKAYDTKSIAEGGTSYGHYPGEPARIASYVRDHLFFRPTTPSSDPTFFVVVDRPTTWATKFEKRWELHTPLPPTITAGTTTANSPTRNGHSQGHTTYTGVTQITWDINQSFLGTTLSGTGYLTTLQPSSFKAIVIGGPNGSGTSWTTDSHEFEDPYGVQESTSGDPSTQYVSGEDATPFVGAYTLELTPTTPATVDTFANVIEIADHGATKTTINDGSTATMVSALIQGATDKRGFALAMNGAGSLPWTFKANTAGTYKFLVGDLPVSASRTLTPGGNINIASGGFSTNYVATSTAGGTLWFTFTVTCNTACSNGAANTVTIN